MDNLWIIYGYGWWLNPTPLKKYEFVNWDDEITKIWKTNKCSRPPTSCDMSFIDHIPQQHTEAINHDYIPSR